MPTSISKKKTQKMPVAKKRTHRTNLQGIPEFMLRLARQQQVKIFETLALPKYRHD